MVVEEVMSRYIVRVSYDESAFRASELMRRNKIGVLPVVRGTSVVGMITDRDLVTRCIAQGKLPIETAVDRIMCNLLFVSKQLLLFMRLFPLWHAIK